METEEADGAAVDLRRRAAGLRRRPPPRTMALGRRAPHSLSRARRRKKKAAAAACPLVRRARSPAGEQGQALAGPPALSAAPHGGAREPRPLGGGGRRPRRRPGPRASRAFAGPRRASVAGRRPDPQRQGAARPLPHLPQCPHRARPAQGRRRAPSSSSPGHGFEVEEKPAVSRSQSQCFGSK
ncbi:hypothetical protein ACP4OV_003067 [Aristida adscensionis]